jgi:C-terminal processing protease CtpA/Prc
VALAYAGFFTDSPVPAFSKEIRTRSGYTPPETARTIATDLPLTQPVYLLNSGYTAGAAEVLALALGEMPQVTVIGARTAGALSDIMEITLPTDWRLGMAHQVYRNAAGTVVNGVGVAPDTALPFDAPAFRAGRDPGLGKVLEMIATE